MPLVVDKYLGDTMHLNTEQHGAYLLLLVAMWKRDGSLQNDDAELSAIARLSLGRWKTHKPVLMRFFTVEGDLITQKRLSAELANSKAITQSKAEAGAKGASKRWQKDGTAIAQPLAEPIANGSQSTWQTDASISLSIPSSSLRSEEIEESKLTLAPPRPKSDDSPALSLVESKAPEKPRPPDCPHLELLALWAEVLPAMPQHEPGMWGGTRADHLRARWREAATSKKWPSQVEGMAYFRKLFVYVGQSKFLTGRVESSRDKRPFYVELAWLVNPQNWAKVHEGKYHTEAA